MAFRFPEGFGEGREEKNPSGQTDVVSCQNGALQTHLYVCYPVVAGEAVVIAAGRIACKEICSQFPI